MHLGNPLFQAVKIIRNLCTAAFLCSTCAATANTVTLSIVTNGPANAGIVTGAGIYTNGATPTVGIQAFQGYYIKDLLVTFMQSPPRGWVPPQFFAQKFAIEIGTPLGGIPDLTQITNDFEDLPAMLSDAVLTVTFDSSAPTFRSLPTNQVVVTGTEVALSGIASGRQPLNFQWLKDGLPVIGATNAAVNKSIFDSLESDLVFTNSAPTNSGAYTLVISDEFGVSNSMPVSVVVKDVLFSLDGQPLTNSSITATTNDYVSIQSLYTNGIIFYTLDGSTPDFNGMRYAGAFSLAQSATLRASAYSSDFAHSVVSDPLAVTILPSFSLTTEVLNDGGGWISLDPPGGPYQQNAVVTVTAVPDSGWSFMGWSEDVGGTTLTNSVVMSGPKLVQAAFGTTVATTVAGNGNVNIRPAMPMYVYGSHVEVTAVPAVSNYFVAWGNGAVGSVVDIWETLYQPNPTFSALFAPLPSGYVTLTVLAEGGGSAGAASTQNQFPVGSTNLLRAFPQIGQEFLGWSGDVSGSSPELPIVLDSSKTVIAHFTRNTTLQVQSINPLRVAVTGIFGDAYDLQATTNLIDWVPVSSATNFEYGAVLSDPDSSAFPARVYRVVVR